MAQATDGNWYAYFAEVEQAQLADATNTNPDAVTDTIGTGLDFGEFCSPTTGNLLLGFSVSETKGVAIGTTGTGSGVNGTTTAVTQITASCTNSVGATDKNGTINVVREAKQLNLGASQGTGQIGFNTTLYPNTTTKAAQQNQGTTTLHTEHSIWPFIQLYDFAVGGEVEVTYNKAGGAQTATLVFDESSPALSLDRDFYPKDADVHFEIADNWLNIDPTDEDSWTFGTAVGSETVKYQYYNEGGVSYTTSGGSAASTNTKDISGSLSTLMNGDAKLVIKPSVNGNDIIDFTANGNAAAASASAVTILETGVNTGIFSSYDTADESIIEIKADAARGNSASISYDDSPVSVVVRSSFATIDMIVNDDEWNSGEAIDVVLVDQDINKNSRSDEDLAVENSAYYELIPTLVTGDPFTLGEKDSTLEVAFYNGSDDIVQSTTATKSYFNWPGASNGNGTGTVTVSSFSQVGKIEITDASGAAGTGTGTNAIAGFLIDLEATMTDLKETFKPATTFYGTNLFAYNVESFSTTQTVAIYLVNASSNILDSDSDVQQDNDAAKSTTIKLVGAGNATKGLVSLESAESVVNKARTGNDDNQHLGILVEFSGTTTLTEGTTEDAVTFDFMSFGFTNDGEDAADRYSNQIIRFELEETGDNTATFEGTVEYVMINQLNVITTATYTGLDVESDSPSFIAFEDLTDEDSPRINYLDLGADGVQTQIADQQAAPSHSAKFPGKGRQRG